MISKTQLRACLSVAPLFICGVAAALAPAQPVALRHEATPNGHSQLAADNKTATDKKMPEGDPVPLEKLPKAVADGVKKALPGARIVKAIKLADGTYFLDDVKVGKKEYDVTVTPEGKVLKSEEQKDND